ncbi:hypothetical protein [Pedomonas mirosovicensis]|uniref:hypothetical protein n=1 Tax=Pedomonas mirosovicensis TaxID=2908641 RepID=UPI00216AADAA|nr:hypothetical protein [Pedomonas mirosovicensis]MCH8684334.1 hypothetical protein [Pedomonas mirosovicensis]
MSERKPHADVASRRHLLKLGAMAAPAVITLAPASARAATSVLHCFVPMPTSVNERGEPCSGATQSSQQVAGTSDSTGMAMGHTMEQSNAHGLSVGHDKTQTGQTSGSMCYLGPDSGGLTAQQIQNGFGIDGISADKDQYDAYVAYLNKVKQEHGAGVSCLMSLDLAQG